MTRPSVPLTPEPLRRGHRARWKLYVILGVLVALAAVRVVLGMM